MDKIRAFIALDVSDEAISEISKITDELRSSGADVKWVKPTSVHLTLKFLGAIEEEMVPGIKERMIEIADKTRPFDLVLNDIGVFPGWSRANVIWVGFSGEIKALKDLASRIEDSLEVCGFNREDRDFKAHLTIGRVKSKKNKNKLKEVSENIGVTPVPSSIKCIKLIRSDLTPAGAIYTELAEARFLG